MPSVIDPARVRGASLSGTVSPYDRMMETNVYVVSNCWWRDGATVIGAATDRAGAEQIADRTGDSAPGGWSPWREAVEPQGSCTWSRDALNADGTRHASLYQEIVCVPLAGAAVALEPECSPGERLWATASRGARADIAEIAEVGRVWGAP